MHFSDLWQNGFFASLPMPTPGTAVALYAAGCVLTALLAYLLGSLNFGVILSRGKYHEDVREHGSGNAGMTNMLRTYGRGAAVLTLLGDAAKTVLAVLVVGRLCCGMLGGYLAGLFCVVGHAYPLYFSFRGGKGVVVTATTVFCLAPIVGAVGLLIFAIVVLSTRYVSLGSVICMLMYPFLQSRLVGNGIGVLFAALIALFVIFLHRSNLRRLREGSENKISLGKKKKPNPDETKENR